MYLRKCSDSGELDDRQKHVASIFSLSLVSNQAQRNVSRKKRGICGYYVTELNLRQDARKYQENDQGKGEGGKSFKFGYQQKEVHPKGAMISIP